MLSKEVFSKELRKEKKRNQQIRKNVEEYNKITKSHFEKTLQDSRVYKILQDGHFG